MGGTAHPSATVDWPEPASATRVDVADMTLVVLAPADRQDGPLARFANGPNGGLYALAWKVADPEAMAARFADNHTCNLTAASVPIGCGSTHELLLDGARHWFVKD